MTSPLASTTGNAPTAGLRRFYLSTAILLVAFSFPLFELLRFSLQSPLFSHIVLIPFVSLYLVWQQRTSLPGISAPYIPLAIGFFSAGLALLATYLLVRFWTPAATPVNAHALSTLSFLSCLGALCAWLLGRSLLRTLIFPLTFLLFMVPFPAPMETAIETFLQHGSAAVAHALFKLAGTTVFVEGLSFQLPGITIQVAPECSGIHSSLALLITSVVTGYLLLRTSSRRLILALAVIPLALLRNGFRVFVIGELCVRIGPEMIDSYVHRRGGPIFFVLSLVPFFLLLVLLLRSERKTAERNNPTKP